MAAWEYKTYARAYDGLLTEAELNQLGAQGFELVGALNISEQVTVVGRHETHTKIHYFFKRAKA
jgi:hypothetical protein